MGFVLFDWPIWVADFLIYVQILGGVLIQLKKMRYRFCVLVLNKISTLLGKFTFKISREVFWSIILSIKWNDPVSPPENECHFITDSPRCLAVGFGFLSSNSSFDFRPKNAKFIFFGNQKGFLKWKSLYFRAILQTLISLVNQCHLHWCPSLAWSHCMFYEKKTS